MQKNFVDNDAYQFPDILIFHITFDRPIVLAAWVFPFDISFVSL